MPYKANPMKTFGVNTVLTIDLNCGGKDDSDNPDLKKNWPVIASVIESKSKAYLIILFLTSYDNIMN